MTPYLKEAGRSLLANQQRTLLALIGIVIGIGSVIALVSIGRIVTHEATKQFLAMGTDLLSIQLRTEPNDPSLTQPTLMAGLADTLSCLRLAAPFTRSGDQYRRSDGEGVDYAVVGVTADFAQINKLQVTTGRFVSDLDATRYFAVIGAELPERLEMKGAPAQWIGQEVRVREAVYTIVGVLAPSDKARQTGVDANLSLFIPLANALQQGRRVEISQVAARMAPEVDEKRCVGQVEQYFLRRNPRLTLRVTTAEELIARMRKQTDMLNVLLSAIASISLVVGGVGIMNIMLMSVTERREEIGIRRAVGARRRDIRAQFLVEALLLSLVGGAIGIVLGIGISYLVADLQKWDFFLTPFPIVVGAGVSALIGIFFGFFPAHQAAQLDPITALRG